MKNEKNLNTHYLSLSYNFLIRNKELHYLFFLIEIIFIFLQILQIYFNKYESIKSENIKLYSVITPLIISIKKFDISIQFGLYIIIILLLTFFGFILKFMHLKKNKVFGIIINFNGL